MKKKIKKYFIKGSDSTRGSYDDIWVDSNNLIQLYIMLDNSMKGKETMDINLMFSGCEVFLKEKELIALIEILDKFGKELM